MQRAGSYVKIEINVGNFVIKVNPQSHDVRVTEYVVFNSLLKNDFEEVERSRRFSVKFYHKIHIQEITHEDNFRDKNYLYHLTSLLLLS